MFELFTDQKSKESKFSWKAKLIEIILTALLAATFIELGNRYILNQ